MAPEPPHSVLHMMHDACRCPPADFKRPGHIFPLRYHPGGVLVRPGHTEAGVDLARLAGCYPSGCLSEIVDKRDGSMARLMQLLEFAKQHGLKCITIAQLIRHRLQHEEVVQEVSQAPVSLPLSGYLSPQKLRCTMRVFRYLPWPCAQVHQHCPAHTASPASRGGCSGGVSSPCEPASVWAPHSSKTPLHHRCLQVFALLLCSSRGVCTMPLRTVT